MKTFILTITAILLLAGIPNAIPEALVLTVLWLVVAIPNLKSLPKRKSRRYTGRALS
jgi:hypothetical protein